MLISLVILAGLLIGGYIFFGQKQFGKDPSGERLERIRHSPNAAGGIFRNRNHTPTLPDGVTYRMILRAYLKKKEPAKPAHPLVSVKTDLKELHSEKPVIIWFGHSSYLIRIDGKTILVDPVFSGHASPFSFNVKSYNGSNTYTVDDLPELDLVLITHDHYDHLDYETIVKLKDKTKQFYTSLGVGAHLAHWGIDERKIAEFDWWDEKAFTDRITFIAAPARHFSGRTFTRGKTLWASYILQTPSYRLFLGGDSGYDTHFAEIGDKFGPFDLAILECGQYNEFWPFIHMMPEETAQAAIDLKAKVLMPVHWAKFTLSLHKWDDPVKRVVPAAARLQLPITTPMIGEPVIIGGSYPTSKWWEGMYLNGMKMAGVI
jgi:L-ascorbate metabolism protein UlaG (beta-lactamase superfamily)